MQPTTVSKMGGDESQPAEADVDTPDGEMAVGGFARWEYGWFQCMCSDTGSARKRALGDHERFRKFIVALHKELGVELPTPIVDTGNQSLSVVQLEVYDRVFHAALESVDLIAAPYFRPNWHILVNLVRSDKFDESQIMAAMERASKTPGLRTFEGFVYRLARKVLT